MEADPTPPVPARPWALTLLVFAVVAVGLLADLANLLNFQHYPALRAEVVMVAAALILAAAAMAGLHRLAQPRLAFAFTGLYVALLIDLGSTLNNLVFPISAAVIAALAWWNERAVLKLSLAAFLSVLAFQAFDLIAGAESHAAPRNEAKMLQPEAKANPKLRPIVHLMLDSYIGLEGMSAADTNFGTLRQEQERFYLDHGFQFYPQAYSRHPKTINALPEFLSYGRAAHATEPRNVQSTVAPPLAYFRDLDRTGYRISALTPSFVDLCPNQPMTLCRNYNRSDLSALVTSGLSVPDRARIIGFTLLELSQFTALLGGTADLKLAELRGSHERHLYNRAKLYSMTGLRQLDAVSADLSTLQFGEMRFVHLLLPHDPYVLDEHCRLLPEALWIDEHGPAPLHERDAAFARQARCMTNQGLSRLLDQLERTEAGRAAIVIVQGDHGSRAIDAIPAAGGALPSPREMAVLHSAFFAIRVPGEAASEVPGRFALDELIGGFAASGFTAAPHPVAGPAEVWLMDPNWIPTQRIALPPFTQKFPKN